MKDPLFFASRVFVKLPQRVAALAMIMGLCLLVYSIGQRQLRQALAQAEATIPNQQGKQTERPTLRWVMQCFQSVHLIWVEGRKWAIKLNERFPNTNFALPRLGLSKILFSLLRNLRNVG